MTGTGKKQSSRSRLPLILLLIGILLLLGWLGVVTYRAVSLYNTALEIQDQYQLVVDEGIARLDINEVEALTYDLQEDLVRLRRDLGPLLVLAPYLSWLPEIGTMLSSSPHLMDMAVSGSDASVHLIEGLRPVFPYLQGTGIDETDSLGELLVILTAAAPEIEKASADLARTREAREKIDNLAGLPRPVREALERFDREIPTIENALLVSGILPELLGSQQRRTYLIMAQNEDELRPTGGFISGAGLISLEGGEIVSIEFTDASLVDDWRNKPYDFPPQPFYEIMGMDIFLFRDVNFWPDFPTTAEKAMELYTYGQGVALDGVIAIDQRFIQMLLTATGPLVVPEIAQTVTAANVVEQMRAQWSPGEDSEGNWILERKSFMEPMAIAIRQALQSELSSINLLDLAREMEKAARQRHLQVYVRDPRASKVLAESGWDGHIANDPGQDFLLTVETSMGFNKVSAAIERMVIYQVALSEDGPIQADLELEYTHTIPPTAAECQHGTNYDNLTSYDELLNDCYWNYVRIYVPAGSTLIGSNINPVPAEQLLSGQPWEGEARVFGETDGTLKVFDNFYLIRQGETFKGKFQYLLPDSVIHSDGNEHTYHLIVGKQAGVDELPILVRVTLPDDAEFINAVPEPFSVDGQEIIFSSSLSSDGSLTITYR